MSYDINKWAATTLATRPRRRGTRWMLLGASVLMVGWLALETMFSTADAHGFPDLIFIWLPLLSLMTSPFARDTWLTDRGLDHYDEFERAALGRATSRAYLVLILAGAGLLLLAALALAQGAAIAVTPRLLVIWATAVLSLGLTLPVLFAEFAVPFPPPADDEGPL